MKASILSLLLIPIIGLSINGQSLAFRNIVTDPSNNINAVVRADTRGGTISFDRTYDANCRGSYAIQWSFSKDLTTLNDGEEFRVTLSCTTCNTPCGYKWTIASVTGSNNITSIPSNPTYQYNGNIGMVSTTAEAFGVHDWYPGHLSHSYTFKYKNQKDVPLSAFVFTFAEFHVYYVFQPGGQQSQGPINCHTLLGLGKLVASLEFGALEGYGWTWMDETIDFALNHIEATNCLSNTYLTGLKSRIFQSTNTTAFLNEIQAYSRRLEGEVANSCSACSACSQ